VSQEVITWEQELEKAAKEVASRERPSLSNISLRNGIMQLSGTPVPGNALPCVIIASAFENQWFAGDFDPNNIKNPDCYALSDDGENMVPDPSIEHPQHENCTDCPKGQWRTDRRGGKGKDCKEKRRLALLPSDALKDGNIKTAEMAVLTLPVTSRANWANYVNQLAAEHRRPPWAVLSTVSVHPHPKNQFEVRFKCDALVNEDHLSDLNMRIGSAMQVLLTPYDKAGGPAIDPTKPADAKPKKY
jgi:hypothetical protein